MTEVARRCATYEDILAAPEHMVAELLAGELHLHPRPAAPHAAAATALAEELGPPFKRGKGGPGGWIILYEPELHLADGVLVPDLAGWRRTTMDHGSARCSHRPPSRSTGPSSCRGRSIVIVGPPQAAMRES